MTDSPIFISVAEVKRRFADVLGAVRYGGERYVIQRNGTPLAALVPLSDLPGSAEESEGFLALVGAFEGEEEFPALLEAIWRDRARQRSRPAPQLS
jgi:prevent-host-death family protein